MRRLSPLIGVPILLEDEVTPLPGGISGELLFSLTFFVDAHRRDGLRHKRDHSLDCEV